MDLTTGRAAAVDRLLAAYNTFMACAWLVALGRSPLAPWLCIAHVAALSIPVLLSRQEQLRPIVALLRHAYPLLLLALFWSEVDLLRQALHVSANDGLIRSLDVWLFGSPVHSWLMPAYSSLWISEPLHFAYFMYYLGIGVPLIALALQRRAAALREMNFRLLLTYTACFTLYALFPVDGPHHLEGIYAGNPASGVWYRIVHAVNSSGGSLGAAFPSSHAAGAVTIAINGCLFFSRRVALVLGIHAAAVVIATCYTQYHYAVDPLAGVILAVVLQLWLAPRLLGWGRPPAPGAPFLPVVPRPAWPADAGGVR